MEDYREVLGELEGGGFPEGIEEDSVLTVSSLFVDRFVRWDGTSYM